MIKADGLTVPTIKQNISYRTGPSRKYQCQFSITIIVNLRCFFLAKNHAKTLLRSTNDVARHCLRWYSVFLMDSRKVKDFGLQGQKASPAYFHEQSKLRKRLDGYEREKEKCLRKISDRQDTLMNVLVNQRSVPGELSVETKTHIEAFPSRLRRNTISTLASENPTSMEIYSSQLELRKLSISSDSRYRNLSSYSTQTINENKVVRKLSDPLEFADHRKLTVRPKRKLTTGQIELAVSSKGVCPYSFREDTMKYDLLKNQSIKSDVMEFSLQQVKGSNESVLTQSRSEHKDSKVILASHPSSVANMQFNKTGAQLQSKHLKEAMINTPKKLLHQRPSTSNEFLPNFQGMKSVLSKETEMLNTEAQNDIHKITPATISPVIERQLHSVSESSTKNFETLPHLPANCDGKLNLMESESGPGEGSKFVLRRKKSISTDISTRHLHEQTISISQAGATPAVGFHRNAWSAETNSPRRKISTVKAPEGIIDHVPLSRQRSDDASSLSKETQRNFEALRNFRRLALVVVAAERFRSNTLESHSEDREETVAKRKFSSKSRLEDLQRPTESYRRQIVADEDFTPVLKTRSRSLGAVTHGKTSVSGIAKFRRVTQAAMATQILLEKENRKETKGRFSSVEARQEINREKSLAEMMNELKDCRYLRTGSISKQD